MRFEAKAFDFFLASAHLGKDMNTKVVFFKYLANVSSVVQKICISSVNNKQFSHMISIAYFARTEARDMVNEV